MARLEVCLEVCPKNVAGFAVGGSKVVGDISMYILPEPANPPQVCKSFKL